jgi:hypothetical protein
MTRWYFKVVPGFRKEAKRAKETLASLEICGLGDDKVWLLSPVASRTMYVTHIPKSTPQSQQQSALVTLVTFLGALM